MKLKRFEDFKPLNEAVLQKDLDRMDSILKKSNGDKEKMMNYVHSMAKAIKDPHKALQRGRAADEILKDKDAGNVFYNRAIELGLDVDINLERSKRGLSMFGIEVPTLGSKIGKQYEEGKGTRVNGYILSIGTVNIQTGESKYFNIYDTWPDSLAEVWKDEKGNYKLLFTAGSKPMGDIGATGFFHDSQSHREIGYGWELVEWVKVKDLKDILREFNKKSMRGYTYK